MTAVEVCLTRECPTCQGSGEIGTHQDYWGNWETARCRECQGHGEVDALAWADTHCEHDVHHEDECPDCRGPVLTNPWKAGAAHVTGGWDAEPPF